MNNNLHEKETVVLTSPRRLTRKQLHLFLTTRNFKSIDDFYELFRPGRIEPWQSATTMDVNVLLSGHNVYETQEDIAEGVETMWDELHCDYLLATLPRDSIKDFVCEIGALRAEFTLQMTHEGDFVDTEELETRFNRIADDLSAELDSPGSETLRILIEQQYR